MVRRHCCCRLPAATAARPRLAAPLSVTHTKHDRHQPPSSPSTCTRINININTTLKGPFLVVQQLRQHGVLKRPALIANVTSKVGFRF